MNIDKKGQENADLKNEVAALKKILALTPGNVYWKDRSGKYLGCNGNNARAMGLESSQEIIGKTLYDLIPRELADPTQKVDDEIIASNQELTLEEYGYDATGNSAVYLTRKVPLHDEKGKAIGLVGISIDITERKKIEEELRIIREKEKNEEIFSLKRIISLMQGSIYWKDRSGKYLGCNDYMAKIIQLNSPEEVYGKDDIELIGPELAKRIQEIDNGVMTNNEEYFAEEMGINGDEPAIYLTRKIPLYNEIGRIVGLIGMSMDITDRKKMEAELVLAKEKAEAALKAKEIAEAESREKSITLQNILAELKQEKYYLAGEHGNTHLTRREAECVACLMHGNSVKTIAKNLGLSPRTAEEYLNRSKEKLGCKTNAELIQKVVEGRFLDGIRPVLREIKE